MNEFWVQVQVRSAMRPVIVVDVSRSAVNLWPVFCSTLEALAEELPTEQQPDVIFLGSTDRLNLSDCISRSEALLQQHRGRGRIISPLLESFGERWPSRVVVLAAESVHDLSDWQTHPQYPRVKLLSPKPNLGQPLTDLASVLDALKTPPPSVRIRAAKCQPYQWDQPAYYLDRHGLNCSPGQGVDVKVGFLGSGTKNDVVAVLVQEDGSLDHLTVSSCEPLSPASWTVLSPGELGILQAWRSGRSIHCSVCGNDHSPGEMCSRNRLFPSLKHLPRGSFVRLKIQLFQAAFQPWPGTVFKMDESTLLVRMPAEPEPQSWHWQDDHWQATGEKPGLFFAGNSPDLFILALPFERERDA